MAMTVTKNIIIFVLLCGIANCLTSSGVFDSIIKNRCYNKTNNEHYWINGQKVPLSSSMETLIGLLERFEANYTFSSVEVAEKFLRRFRIDGYTRIFNSVKNDYTFTRNPDEQSRQKITESVLFGSNMRGFDFPEEAFTEDEKCALYYMMSHTFVECEQYGTYPSQSPENKCVIEQGVVSLYDHKIHAIAPARLLLGILAGLRRLPDISTRKILSDLGTNLDHLGERQKYLEDKIDPIYAVTVGDVVVEEMRRVLTDKKSRKYGPNGSWNSTLCPTRYYLYVKGKPTKATYAELRGAGDGLLLGLAANQLELKNQKTTISSMLRMYYSEHGLHVPGRSERYSYCKRYDNWGYINDKLKEQILRYAQLSSIERHVSDEQQDLRDEVEHAMREFESSKREIVDNVIGDRCVVYEQNPCETNANVFVVMDHRGNDPEVKIKQNEIISGLTTYLDIGLSRGSMTVMTNSRGFGDRQLEYVVENTTLKGCVGCSTNWFLPQGSTEDEVYVFQSINKTLMKHEKETEMHPGVPAKVLIYFNYAEAPSKDDRNLRNALWEVHNKHRDVPIFAIGKSSDLLKRFATDGNKALLSDDFIIKTLNDEICEAFSTFQYPFCWQKKSSMDDWVYEGYITSYHSQYWAMFPEYFIKSFKIKFSFSAEGGQITICHSRESRRDVINRNCKDTSGTGTERSVEFTMSNPCKGKNVYNCDPFYFIIKGKETDSDRLCTEKGCKYNDQIKFTVRHEGVSCNNSSSLISSLQIIIALFVLFCLVRKNV